MKTWSVYILRCSDGTLYTGITNDLEKRIESHSNGQGSKYTRSRLPVELVYLEQAGNRGEATRRELEIKDLSRGDKMKMVGTTWHPPGLKRPQKHV
ncbi:MAG: GIY-YIG nuclease family protein [Pseudomonadota bacterium]|nr:GIY-YIG nuclease family protein [Pseudomonadota bacterium]